MNDILLTVALPIALAHLAATAVIVFVIKRLLMGDTMNAVNRIKQVENEVRKKEEAIRLEIKEHEKEFERKKAEAQEDLVKRQEESAKELANTKEQIVGEAKKEADRITDQAKKNEEKLRQQIAQSMEEKAVDYGGEIFKLVFSDKMNEALNKQFIGELLDALEEIDAASITVDASEANFTSSHSIDPEQKKRLEKLLADKFNANIKVEEKVQEDLLAGLILKLGSLEIDGSLINRYREAAAEVKKTVQV
ncbi:F0F1 ATP synthase subunit delta [Verrucomicrobiota bacterium]